jgi:hypothetical protein
MKTASLRPGDRIRRKSSAAGTALVWKVLRLQPKRQECPALVVMTLDLGRDFDGPAPQGEVQASAAEVSRYFEQVQA